MSTRIIHPLLKYNLPSILLTIYIHKTEQCTRILVIFEPSFELIVKLTRYINLGTIST